MSAEGQISHNDVTCHVYNILGGVPKVSPLTENVSLVVHFAAVDDVMGFMLLSSVPYADEEWKKEKEMVRGNRNERDKIHKLHATKLEI